MRIAVLSDIHGNSAALDAVLADVAHDRVTGIVNLGDCLSGPLDPAGTAERLMRMRLPTVMGNHDRALIDRPPSEQSLWEQWTFPQLRKEHLDWIRAFPASIRQDGVFFCHGTPESDEENWLHARGPDGHLRPAERSDVERIARGLEVPLMLCGHTHVPALVRLADGRLVANPGSVGLPAYADTRVSPPTQMALMSPHARYAILEKLAVGWRAEFRAVPYDPTEMVARARARGATDWAEALSTGFVTLT